MGFLIRSASLCHLLHESYPNPRPYSAEFACKHGSTCALTPDTPSHAQRHSRSRSPEHPY